MFTIYNYIVESVCFINNYIGTCVSNFFTTQTQEKASQTLAATQVPPIDKNKEILESLQEVKALLKESGPKIDFLMDYLDAVVLKQQKAKLGTRKTLNEQVSDLIDGNIAINEKLDSILELYGHADSMCEVLKIITS